MALDNRDIKQLKTLFDDQGNRIDKRVKSLFDEQEKKINKHTDEKIGNVIKFTERKINESDKKTDIKINESDKKTDGKIEVLARMIAKEFKEIHKKLDKNDKDHEEFKKDLSAHDFKMGELVHKAEYYNLEERVRHIETRLKMKPA